jgi:hypothetical protein
MKKEAGVVCAVYAKYVIKKELSFTFLFLTAAQAMHRP